MYIIAITFYVQKGVFIMPEYEKMYLKLFNAVTDALAALAEKNFGTAAELLRRGQETCEELYMDET